MAGFTRERDGLLDFARRSEVEAADQSPRPKKRRKINMSEQRGGIEADKRNTRSQSRREAVHASQESIQKHVVADSDGEAGSEYDDEVDTIAQAALTKVSKQLPDDGLVACPGCGKRMKEEVVFTHLDHCASMGGDGENIPAGTNGTHKPQPQPQRQRSTPSIAYTHPDSSKPRDRLPTLAYSMFSDTTLRKKLKELGISPTGPKLLLQKRHTEWVNLWNANCDSRNPMAKRELLRELDVWERTQGRQILNGMNVGPASNGGQGMGVMAKDFDGEAWMKENKNDFEDLVKRAREKKTAPPPAPPPAATEAEGETRSEQPKVSLQEIFRTAGSGSSPQEVSALTDSEPKTTPTLEGTESAKKSPFFDTNGPQAVDVSGGAVAGRADHATSTPLPDVAMVDLTSSPLKPPLDPQQSQGSHADVVIV